MAAFNATTQSLYFEATSREASPQRLKSSLETSPASSQYSPSPAPQVDTDHSDDEYIDTIDSAPDVTSKKSSNTENIPNGHGPKEPPSRSRPKTKFIPTVENPHFRVDISQEISKTVQSLKADIERLSTRMTSLEKTTKTIVAKKPKVMSFSSVSPTFLAFIILWPFVTHSLLRYWSNRK